MFLQMGGKHHFLGYEDWVVSDKRSEQLKYLNLKHFHSQCLDPDWLK